MLSFIHQLTVDLLNFILRPFNSGYYYLLPLNHMTYEERSNAERSIRLLIEIRGLVSESGLPRAQRNQLNVQVSNINEQIISLFWKLARIRKTGEAINHKASK